MVVVREYHSLIIGLGEHMKHPRTGIGSKVSFSTSDTFARMGVAMEELMAATPKILGDVHIDGSKECHGMRKESKKAA